MAAWTRLINPRVLLRGVRAWRRQKLLEDKGHSELVCSGLLQPVDQFLGDQGQFPSRSMFTSGLTESTQKEVPIVGVEAESMDLVLNYAYTSRVVLTEANVQALFTAASIFQIPSIQDQCAQYMVSHLDPQNSIGVFIFADHYGH